MIFHIFICIDRLVVFFLFRTVEDYMSDTVDFVITNENWDKNFDEVRKITISYERNLCRGAFVILESDPRLLRLNAQ